MDIDLLDKDLKPKPKFSWIWLVTMASGIFIGSFWLIFNFLSVIKSASACAWWDFPIALLPGAGILFLVLMARRSPLPYGAGLVVLGLYLFGLGYIQHVAWFIFCMISIPMLLVGIVFVFWGIFQLPQQHF